MGGGLLERSASRSSVSFDVAKILIVSILVQTFFLFTSNFTVPGGAAEFFAFAEALLHGQKVTIPTVATRDIGYPFLLILSGYFVTNSLIGITLLHAVMGMLIPIFIYLAIAPSSRACAFYTALASIVTLSPFFFVKWIHHDHAYVFFSVVVVWAFCRFLSTKRPADLYLLTFALIAASLTRPAGNVLFPVLIVVAYVAARGPARHYLVCALIFTAAMGGYGAFRYHIFDMAHRTDTPSYTGQQIFYNLYMNSKEYGIELSENLGPHMRQITESVYQAMLPDPRTSEILKKFTSSEQAPSEFVEKVTTPFLNKYFYPYSAADFRSQLYREPNWEYFLLMSVAEPNDQVYLRACWEIVKAYPLYPVKYAARNLWRLLYEPGYAHGRFATGPMGRGGQFFPFDGQAAIGGAALGAAAAMLSLSPRATREVSFDSLAVQPEWAKQLYGGIKSLWFATYDPVVRVIFFLSLIAWLYLLFTWAAIERPAHRLSRRLIAMGGNDLAAPIVGVSAVLLYNALVTAAFAEPDYRYHDMMLPIKVVLAGFGGIALARLVLTLAPRGLRRAPSQHPFATTGTLALVLCALWAWYMVRRSA